MFPRTSKRSALSIPATARLTFRGVGGYIAMMPRTNATSAPDDLWSRSRVLVTGGAGFIGSALVWELNRRGCSDVVIADFASQAERNGNLQTLRFTNYLDPHAAVADLGSGRLGKFDFIFHLGACSSTLEQNADYLRRN